jgi:hypothetical protein
VKTPSLILSALLLASCTTTAPRDTSVTVNHMPTWKHTHLMCMLAGGELSRPDQYYRGCYVTATRVIYVTLGDSDALEHEMRHHRCGDWHDENGIERPEYRGCK